MDIGGRIRTARRARGMTQEELARRAGMSLKGMGDIERGAIPDPHYSSLNKIAEGLDLSVGELLEGEQVLVGKAEAPTAGLSEAEMAEAGRRSVDYRKLYFDLGDRLLDQLDQALAMIDEVLTTEDYAEFIKLPADEQHWRIETAERLRELARELIESLEEDPGAVALTNAQHDELAERRRRLDAVGAVAEEFRRTA